MKHNNGKSQYVLKFNITLLLNYCNFATIKAMRIKGIILFCGLILVHICGKTQPGSQVLSFNFLGTSVVMPANPFPALRYTVALTENSIQDFYKKLNSTDYQPLIDHLLNYRDKEKLDDWLYYQLIRKTAQQISPKAENYFSYTIYKWFLLTKSGYDAMIRISTGKMLLYVQSDELIYNIPYLFQNTKQYVCLNYHDYGNDIDFNKEHFNNVSINIPEGKKAFTYKVNHLPDIKSDNYIEKNIGFNYSRKQYHFNIKLNPEIKALFTNYPASDYGNQFNMPLSKETYNSLIPQLKEIVSQMKTINGVDYLMHFTRYAFLYQKDTDVFGREKRLSPEETLLYETSDCEDRAALFLFLVKEIYKLPMIVLSYPNHVTVAVNFDKPVGKPIMYNGEPYYICEPTPQKKYLHMGKLLPKLKNERFEIAYVYQPGSQ